MECETLDSFEDDPTILHMKARDVLKLMTQEIPMRYPLPERWLNDEERYLASRPSGSKPSTSDTRATQSTQSYEEDRSYSDRLTSVASVAAVFLATTYADTDSSTRSEIEVESSSSSSSIVDPSSIIDPIDLNNF